MKWLKLAFSLLGFIFEFCIPIILFGGVIPYTYETAQTGLTKMGYIAIIIFALIVSKKIKEKLLQRKKSLVRGLFLSVFPIVMWLIVNLSVDWIVGFIADFASYWDKVIIFIILGRLFYTIEETLNASEETKLDR